jgi:hypothetical protein
MTWEEYCGRYLTGMSMETDRSYQNQIPRRIIVDVFEKNTFICGAKWYLYDTIYPELLF